MAEEEVEVDALAEELGLTPDVLQGPDMPAILANRRDGELVVVEAGVGAEKWARLASYASLDQICTDEVAALQGFRLAVYVMSYFPPGDAERLRSGTCRGVPFRILNPGLVGTKMVAATALLQQRGELPSLLKDVQGAIDELRELGCSVEDPPAPSYSAETRKSANLRLVRTLIEDGVDPHDTILRVDGTLHCQIYCGDGAYDPCEQGTDSEECRNHTSALLRKLVEDVPVSDKKTEYGRILEEEAKIDDDSVALIESKMVWLLHEYKSGLQEYNGKVESLASRPSVIGCGVPRYDHDEVPTSPPVSDGDVVEAHLPWSDSTDEDEEYNENSDGVIDASP